MKALALAGIVSMLLPGTACSGRQAAGGTGASASIPGEPEPGSPAAQLEEKGRLTGKPATE